MIHERLINGLEKKHLLTLKSTEKDFFSTAITDFCGELPSLKFKQNCTGYTVSGLPRNLFASFIDLDGNSKNDPLVNSLIKKVDDGSSVLPKRILFIRKTKPDEKLTTALSRQADRVNHGALTLSGINFDSPFSRNSLKFYAADNNEDVQKTITQLNRLVQPFALQYAACLAVKTISNSENLLSAIAIPLGIPFENFLEIVTATFGDQASQILSQSIGDSLEMVVAAGDRITNYVKNIQKPDDLRKFFGLAGQTLTHLPQTIQSKILSEADTYKKMAGIVAQRLLVFGSMLTATSFFSYLSQQEDSLTYYAVIPFLNNLIVSTYEVYERTKKYNDIKITDSEYEYLLTTIPHPLRNICRQLPRAATLAYSDFSLNKFAVGNLIGNMAATFSVFPMEALGIRREWIYSMSGMMAENAVALGWGTYASSSDTYKEFLKSKFPELP